MKMTRQERRRLERKGIDRAELSRVMLTKKMTGKLLVQSGLLRRCWGMNKRDLKADLELCKQMESNWGKVGTKPWLPEEIYGNFAHVAREGWPHAIERAIKAEALARDLVKALKDVHPRAGVVKWIKRLRVLYKAKEVLGDE